MQRINGQALWLVLYQVKVHLPVLLALMNNGQGLVKSNIERVHERISFSLAYFFSHLLHVWRRGNENETHAGQHLQMIVATPIVVPGVVL
jgi:cobalamin biosynthesis protein CobD/CbiB